jgi:hypothetical protein
LCGCHKFIFHGGNLLNSFTVCYFAVKAYNAEKCPYFAIKITNYAFTAVIEYVPLLKKNRVFVAKWIIGGGDVLGWDCVHGVTLLSI